MSAINTPSAQPPVAPRPIEEREENSRPLKKHKTDADHQQSVQSVKAEDTMDALDLLELQEAMDRLRLMAVKK